MKNTKVFSIWTGKKFSLMSVTVLLLTGFCLPTMEAAS